MAEKLTDAFGVQAAPAHPKAQGIWKLIENKKWEELAEAVAANPALLSETTQVAVSKDTVTMTPVMYAAHMGRKAGLAALYNAGADLVAAGDKGFTPLHLAARARRGSGAVEFILSKSTDSLDARTDTGVTPLIEAARQGNRDSLQSLLAYGAKIDAPGARAMPAIVAAAAAGNADIVIQLAKAGASIHAANGAGRTALWYAVYCRKDNLAEELIGRGADIRVTDAQGTNLLMGAARTGNSALAKQLIEAGIDINQRDRNGCTALHYSCFADGGLRVKETVELLLAHGAYIDAKDNHGELPLDRARRLKSTWQEPMTELFQSKMDDPASARDPRYLAVFTEGTDHRVKAMKTLQIRPAANQAKY